LPDLMRVTMGRQTCEIEQIAQSTL